MCLNDFVSLVKCILKTKSTKNNSVLSSFFFPQINSHCNAMNQSCPTLTPGDKKKTIQINIVNIF